MNQRLFCIRSRFSQKIWEGSPWNLGMLQPKNGNLSEDQKKGKSLSITVFSSWFHVSTIKNDFTWYIYCLVSPNIEVKGGWYGWFWSIKRANQLVPSSTLSWYQWIFRASKVSLASSGDCSIHVWLEGAEHRPRLAILGDTVQAFQLIGTVKSHGCSWMLLCLNR